MTGDRLPKAADGSGNGDGVEATAGVVTAEDGTGTGLASNCEQTAREMDVSPSLS